MTAFVRNGPQLKIPAVLSVAKAIIENEEWLTSLFAKHNIPADEDHFRLFYQAVNKSDWRCGSCGGCI